MEEMGYNKKIRDICEFDLKELTLLEEHLPVINRLAAEIPGLNLWLFLLAAFFVVLNLPNSKQIRFRPTVVTSLTTVLLLVWSVVSLAGVSTFLYFNF